MTIFGMPHTEVYVPSPDYVPAVTEWWQWLLGIVVIVGLGLLIHVACRAMEERQ